MYKEILFIQKKELNSVTCNYVDKLGGHYVGEITQAQKDKHYMILFICVI